MQTRCVTLLLVALLAGCSEPEPRGEGAVAAVGTSLTPSPAVAAALVASLEPDLGGVVPDGVLPRRMARLGRDVAGTAGARVRSLSVVASLRCEARAHAGGHLQVSRGLLRALAERRRSQPLIVAQVAHLVAHVALGHPGGHLVRSLRRVGVKALPGRVGPLVSGEGPTGAAALGRALRVARQGRADVRECAAADRQAVRLLVRLGYRPRALADSYRRLSTVAAHDLAPWIAAHGRPGARVEPASAAARALGRLPARGRPAFELDLTRLLEACRLEGIAAAAGLLVGRGQPQDARRLLERFPRAAATARGALVLAQASGAPRAAERALRAVLLRRPGSHRARLLLTRLYVRQGNLAAAREEARALVKRTPLRAEPHLLLAQSEDDPRRARARYRLARDLDAPDGPVGRVARAALRGRRGSAPTRSGPRHGKKRGSRIMSGGG